MHGYPEDTNAVPLIGNGPPASRGPTPNRETVPIISMDYFFLGDSSRRRKRGGQSLSTNELRRRLRTAMLPADGNRDTLVKRYDRFVSETLREEGMSDISESEEEKGEMKASDNPSIVMIDEETGNKYMRIVDQKGLGKNGEMSWVVKDMHEELKAWGRPGGSSNAIIMKSDGEPALVAVREALARYHGGMFTPEQLPIREHQANGPLEEAGRTVRVMVRTQATT